MPSLHIQRRAVSAASAGDNEIVPAQQGQRIKVLGCLLMAAADVNLKFTDGASGTDLTGLIAMGAKGNGFILPLGGTHWLETSVTTPLLLNLSAGVQVSGVIVYAVE